MGSSRRVSRWLPLCFVISLCIFTRRLPHKGNRPVAEHRTCMLFPVHAPHFNFAVKRLKRTYEWSRGVPPKTVVVLDDDAHVRMIEDLLNGAGIPREHIHLLSLERILSAKDFLQARSFMQDEGQEENTTHATPWHKCQKRTRGRVFQTFKKLYAPMHSPLFCKYFWVSDAESWPFRPYNFSELIALNFDRESKPVQLISSWHSETKCKDFVHDTWTDPSCAVMIQDRFRYTTYWDETSPETLDTKLHHTYFDVNNWWFYDREVIKKMHEMVERTTNKSVVQNLIEMRVADIAVWSQYVQHVGKEDPGMHLRNFPDVIKVSFPKVYRNCCICRHGMQPCFDLPVLFSECFKEMLSMEEITNFLVEKLGVFGIWGDIASDLPQQVFEDKRISWIVNNANKWDEVRKGFVIS